ncbi:serine/threonine-protein kinase 24-like [Quercus lobata]|uniref:Protein kinase domain-containing protein n=1 Tax=Quercus lobata TaxID=97700 RepID=A0A7N2L2W8_QUELO|nr:serine/threonine-protein kinase 24-like [Quercus lobata]
MADGEVQYPSTSRSYKLISIISSSASSTVYKAEYSNTVVAVKIIHLEKSGSNLENGLRDAREVSHENVLTAYCFFRSNDCIWVILPFMYSLTSIKDYLPHRLNEQQIAIILKPTLTALSFLHGQNIFHRNLKLSNILIDSNGSVKISDFGTSSSSSKYVKSKKSVLYWIAPEARNSRQRNNDNAKADIWSFGICALELFHGGPPITCLPNSKPLLQQIRERIELPDGYENYITNPRKLSEKFCEVVKSCLSPNPESRPTAKELLRYQFFKNRRNSEVCLKKLVNEVEGKVREISEPNITLGKFDETLGLLKSGGGVDDRRVTMQIQVPSQAHTENIEADGMVHRATKRSRVVHANSTQNIESIATIDRVTQTINESTQANVGPSANGHVNVGLQSEIVEPPNGSTQNIGTNGTIDRVTQSQHFQTINESTHVNVSPSVNGHVNEDTRSQLYEPPNGSTQNIETYGIVGRVSQSGPSDNGHVNEGTQSQPFQPPPASTQDIGTYDTVRRVTQRIGAGHARIPTSRPSQLPHESTLVIKGPSGNGQVNEEGPHSRPSRPATESTLSPSANETNEAITMDYPDDPDLIFQRIWLRNWDEKLK